MKHTALTLVLAVTLGAKDDAPNVFKARATDHKQKETNASLVLLSDQKRLVVRQVAGNLEVPYSDVSKVTYDFATRRRTKEGAAVAVASLGAGLIVMATKTKSHWLTFDYRDATAGSGKTITLRLDKNNYRKVIDALNRDGLNVAMPAAPAKPNGARPGKTPIPLLPALIDG